ncbi:Dual specificity protein phosphatase cdc14a [Lobulomyces angularis]|nr:Dual specificity protein phosphatase cdc14a [Lobulomyces angularis]
MDEAKRANSAYLISSFMMLVLKRTPEEAYATLRNINPPFVNYRDAGYGPATYFLSIIDCLKGLYRGLQIGLFHIDKFDLEEYEYYDQVQNGDLNWITKKFIALASPKDEEVEKQSSFLRSQKKAKDIVEIGKEKKFFSVNRKDDLIKFLKNRGVSTIVRLNNNVYERNQFVDAEIEHIDLYFPDGSTPPEGILKRFLDLCESRAGPIAVHCQTGLGRTGSLIAAYLMKHNKMTASETISFIRIFRPGSVVGPQQNWLESMQGKLWKMNPTGTLHSSISLYEPSTFEKSKRFDYPKIKAIIQLLNEKKQQFTQEDLTVMHLDVDSQNSATKMGFYKMKISTQQKCKLPFERNNKQNLPNTMGNFLAENFIIAIQPRKWSKRGEVEVELANNVVILSYFDGRRVTTSMENPFPGKDYQHSADAKQNQHSMNGFILQGSRKATPLTRSGRNCTINSAGI